MPVGVNLRPCSRTFRDASNLWFGALASSNARPANGAMSHALGTPLVAIPIPPTWPRSLAARLAILPDRFSIRYVSAPFRCSVLKFACWPEIRIAKSR